MYFIIKLKKEGWSDRKISQKYHISRNTVRNVNSKIKITKRSCEQKTGPRKDKSCIQFKKEKRLLDCT